MSIESLVAKISETKKAIKEADLVKLQLETDVKTYEKEALGLIDRKILKMFFDRDKMVVEYDVDGTIWYLFSMKSFMDPKVSEKISEKDLGSMTLPSWRYEALPYDFPASEPSLKLDKYGNQFYYDAWMLTDCRGHRIHTEHSYEGHRAAPHWYIDGWISTSETPKAIRHYIEASLKKEEDDLAFLRREEKRKKESGVE